MIPPKYVEELKGAPMEDVNFVGTFFEVGDSVVDESNRADAAEDVRREIYHYG
jgi:hypothetical protein